MSAAETLPGFPLIRTIWRVILGYLCGCVLAAVWVTIIVRGGPVVIQFIGDPPPPTEPNYPETFAIMLFIALLGCLVPLAVARILLLLTGSTARVWHALAWAFAGAFVAGGPNPIRWVTSGETAGLFLQIVLPGAVIGVIAHWVEYRGRV